MVEIMESVRDILDTFSKADLIDLIIEYSDNGYYDLDLFLMRAKKQFSAEEIENNWNGFYVKAQSYTGASDDMGADILRDGAELCFEQVKKLADLEQKRNLCNLLVAELTAAAEEDGIGMYTDSEWVYMEVRDRIKAYIEEEL